MWLLRPCTHVQRQARLAYENNFEGLFMEDAMTAKQDTKRKARALGINHVVLEVDDLDAALEFYGAIFDFELRGKSDHNAFIDLGDQFIQLSLRKTQGPDGKRHFGFVVDDLDAFKRRLQALDVAPHSEQDYEPGRRLYFLDPDGIEVELVEYEHVAA